MTDILAAAHRSKPQPLFAGGGNRAKAHPQPDVDREPQVLRPYNRAEAMTVAEAAVEARRSPRTVRDWALLHDLGRKIAGRLALSKVALAMWLDGNKLALALYLAGDRSSELIRRYFEDCGVPLPRQRRSA